jgi:ubiquinol-cytochrome c reductase subunit 7
MPPPPPPPGLFTPLIRWAAGRYQAAVGDTLRKYGLRYDDLLDPVGDGDFGEALRRLPREEVDARNQRLKRAMDLSLKRDYLPPEVRGVQVPFLHYAKGTLDAVIAENGEKAALGAGKNYDRQIP